MRPVIVQVVQHLRPGGIETMALDLMQQLHPKAKVIIFSLEGDEHNTIAQWPRLHRFKHNLRFFDKAPGVHFGLVKQLKQALIDVKADAVHTHHIGPLLYGGGAAKLLNLPHVHTEHDAWHLNSSANRRLQNVLIRLIKPNLVADCDAVAEKLLQHFPFSNPKVILNGIDIERFIPATDEQKQYARAQYKLPDDQFLIGCAARLEEVKGHKYLLRALQHCSENVSLVLAGNGSLRQYLEYEAERLNIKHRVYFLGHIDNTLPFYHAIDLFCLPSLNEGMPLSPLEAQACDIPVIATDVGGCRSVICPNTSALIKPGSARALIKSIQHIQNATETTNPREFVLSIGSLEKTADAYFNLLAVPKGG